MRKNRCNENEVKKKKKLRKIINKISKKKALLFHNNRIVYGK